jgi:hypothetical protein
VAGLVFFPLLLATVARLVCPALRLQLIVAACAGLTALVFAAIKVWPLAGDAYRVGLGALQWPFRALGAALAGHGVPDLASVRLTADATDLYALPAVLGAVWLARRAAVLEAQAPAARGSERGPRAAR